jgi:hypothetical protein
MNRTRSLKRTQGSRRPQGRPHSLKLDIAPLKSVMQMAMVLTTQKPTQRNRQGKVPEDLPGSTLERGMRERKCQELGRSFRLLMSRK